ncbi:peptide MFS transporter [Streptomyces formicae]|uniref:Di-/tripeptide transporter n=1 Tax=Streptomyces formicae TaxID=1616117 RepID=A0A291QAZ2_9ACTN|nr:oligopeptide:H+ symporter [Streptomyces formicae]ATL28980.1 Di-/tripeptide transporter [Streptomyces formicae]
MTASLTKNDGAPPSPNAPAPGGATFFGHPRGLATLFMTEMWERFSFVGMRALLVLYLVAPESKGGLGFDAATGAAIFSVYNAMVYLLALPGGWVADRVWGARKAVAFGGCSMVVGHFLLALPDKATFFGGLVLIALGAGIMKSNISTMVGQLYPDRADPRRDSGFTIFYMGINLGGFIAPLIIGTVGQSVDWHLGFALAGVGMSLGLAQYLLGSRHLAAASSVVNAPLTADERSRLVKHGLLWLVLAAAFYAVVGLTGSLSVGWVLWPLTLAGLALPVACFARIKRDKDLTADEQSKMTGFIWIFVAAAAFFMIYDQAGSVLNLFAHDNTENAVLGWTFPTSWFQSMNPVFVMALAPVAAMLWQWLGSRNPSVPVKFAMALVAVGASFFVMVAAQAAAAGGERVTPMWLATVYLIHAVAELCLSPVGLSATTKLAPRKYASQMMGVWCLAVTAGDCVAAIIQQLMGDATGGGTYFALQATLAVLAGVGIFAFRKPIVALMGDVK